MENKIDKIFKDKLGVRQFAPSDEHIADLNTRLDARVGSKKGLLFLFCSFILVVLLVVLNGTLIPSLNFNEQINSALKNSNSVQKLNLNKVKAVKKEEKFTLHTSTKDEETSLVATEVLVQSKKAELFEESIIKSNSRLKSQNNLNFQQLNSSATVKQTLYTHNPKNDFTLLHSSSINQLNNLGVTNITFTQNQNGVRIDRFKKNYLRQYAEINVLPIVFKERSLIKFPNKIKTEKFVLLKRKTRAMYEVQLEVGLLTLSNYITRTEIVNSTFLTPSIGAQVNSVRGIFHVGAGLNFIQLGDKQIFSINKEEIKSTTIDTSYWVYNQMQDSIYVTDSIVINDTTVISEQFKLSNKFSYLQIPIQFGYVFSVQKWMFIPRASFIVGFAFGDKIGAYPNKEFTQITENRIKNIALSYQFQVDVRRVFGRYYGVFSPRFGGSFSSLFKAYDTRAPTFFGLTFGVGIRL